MSGTRKVRYGVSVDASYVEAVMSGPFRCHHLTAELSPDPAEGKDKWCWYSDAEVKPVETWTKCAKARESCDLKSTMKVRYGVSADKEFNESVMFGPFTCHHSTPGLGPDPAVGKSKWCFVSSQNVVKGCAPIAGWPKCVMLDDPWIIIRGSAKVSDSAMSVAHRIYSTMTTLLNPKKYPKNKMDVYTIYITNGETLAELNKLSPINNIWDDKRRDDLRGGTNKNFAWISEQMMCKTGVRTRTLAFERGERSEDDTTTRTFDQVVHEFGHSLDYRFGRRADINRLYTAWGAGNAVEYFPWVIQFHFGVPPARPGEKPSEAVLKDMAEMFTGTATFPCSMYAEGK